MTLFGCGSKSTCNSFQIIPPIIRVEDAATGEPVCDATVVATSQSNSLVRITLAARMDAGTDAGAGCAYEGLPVNAGEYTLEVSKAGYQTASEPNVEVRVKSCDTPGSASAAQSVTVELMPN